MFRNPQGKRRKTEEGGGRSLRTPRLPNNSCLRESCQRCKQRKCTMEPVWKQQQGAVAPAATLLLLRWRPEMWYTRICICHAHIQGACKSQNATFPRPGRTP